MSSGAAPVPNIWGRKLFKVLTYFFLGFSSLIVVLVTVLALIMYSCEPPSLSTLERRFPRQRHDLETIIAMSNHDAQLLRIDPNWLMTRDHQFMAYSPDTGITQSRWEEYRKLFSANGIAQGIQRDPESDAAFIMVDSVGLLNRGHTNGYLYCGSVVSQRYPPCNSNQLKGEHPYKPGDEAYSFRKLADHWYAYSEGPS